MWQVSVIITYLQITEYSVKMVLVIKSLCLLFPLQNLLALTTLLGMLCGRNSGRRQSTALLHLSPSN